MKSRRKIITGKDHRGVSVEINVLVKDRYDRLSPDDISRLAGCVADDSMKSIVNAPGVLCPLYQVKVR